MSETITSKGRLLLKRHLLHRGIYVPIAKKMRVDASYVSRVASGERKSTKVERAVIVELERIEASQSVTLIVGALRRRVSYELDTV